MRTLRFGAATLLACGLLWGCGSSSTAPTPPNISGTWSGSLLTPSGLDIISVTIAETGSTLSGTWSSIYPSLPANNSGGQLTGTFSGSNVAVTLTPSVPTNCPFTFNATLAPSMTSMSGTYAAFNCTVAASGTLTLTKS